MGPESAHSFPASGSCRQRARGAARTRQAGDRLRAARRGVRFGAFVPATGAVLTVPYSRRTTAAWVDFWSRSMLGSIDHGAGLRRARQPAHPPRRRCLALDADPRAGSSSSNPSTRPTSTDRTLVEGTAVLGPQRPPVRDVGTDLPCGRGRNSLLECPSSSVPLGSAQTAPGSPSDRYRPASGDDLDLPDGPLS